MRLFCPPALFGGAHLPERINVPKAERFRKKFIRPEILLRGRNPSGRTRAQGSALAHYLVEVALRLVVARVALLVGAEGFGVVVASAVDEAGRVLYVKHLVVEDVLDEPLGHVLRVESLADDDRVVDAVVVAEYCARAALRPCERRLLQLAVEKSVGERLRN